VNNSPRNIGKKLLKILAISTILMVVFYAFVFVLFKYGNKCTCYGVETTSRCLGVKTLCTGLAPTINVPLLGEKNECNRINNATGCVKKLECYPVYEHKGPNRDAVGMPILSREYIGCERRSNEEIETAKKRLALCLRSEGNWLYSINGCSCPRSFNSDTGENMRKAMHPVEGCMFVKDICEVYAGVWVNEGYPYNNGIKYHDYCAVDGERIEVEDLF